MSLAKSAEKIRKADFEARVRFLNWPYLDERIENEFKKLQGKGHDTSVLGGLFLYPAKDREPIISSRAPTSRFINSTNILTGKRNLGFLKINEESGKLENAEEKNAQLWYSQSPSGHVMVFVAPYQSNIGKFDESEIIIGKYKKPGEIDSCEIKKHFAVFFKYCACTSLHNSWGIQNYIYRRYLVFNDFRYKATFQAKAFKALERIIILILGGAAVWATLYVGGKI